MRLGRRRRLAVIALLAPCLALSMTAGVPALAQEEPTPIIDVSRVVVPQTIAKLVQKGVRVKASCSIDCVIVVKLRVTKKIAQRLGLGGTLIGSGAAGGKRGEPRWVAARLTSKAGRALEEDPVSGRLDVRIRALP